MPRALIMIFMAITAFPALSKAEQDPTPGAKDARVRWVNYDPINVVKVSAADLHSTMIQFGQDESIIVVACGDTKAWAWQKAGNLLFIKPATSPTQDTNMQVVTVREDATRRVYQFELDAQSADATMPVFGINFRYPGDIAEQNKKDAAKKVALADGDLARQRLEVDLFYGTRNWRYLGRGSVSIEPTEVSDNGQMTAFRFPGNMAVPAIYKINPDGQEQIAAVTMHNDLAVVHGTSHAWRLRMGDQVADLWNLGYDQVGQNPQTGTTSPGVVREVTGKRQ